MRGSSISGLQHGVVHAHDTYLETKRVYGLLQ